MYGKVAKWFKFRAVNHDIIGSNPAETVFFFSRRKQFLLNHLFVDLFCIFSMCLLI